MIVDTLFYIAFFGQIVLISYVVPRKIDRNVQYVLDNFPPDIYPKLYPLPYEVYAKQYRYFTMLCRSILVIGLVLLGFFITGKFENDMQTVVPIGYFFVQYLPIILIEISGNKQLKLMRADLSRRTRKAVLRPRRLWDVVPADIGIAAIVVYCCFAALAIGLELYNVAPEKGYFTLLIITLANGFFLGIIFWNLYGKNQDPYRSDETRLSQIRLVAKSLCLISIAATLFISFTLLLNAFEIESAEGISLCFYLQLISLLSMSSFRIDHVDFEVYKEMEATG